MKVNVKNENFYKIIKLTPVRKTQSLVIPINTKNFENGNFCN